jgi:hypothetical protein
MTIDMTDLIAPLIVGILFYGLFGGVYATFIYEDLIKDAGRDLYKGELLFVGVIWIFIVFVMLVIALFNMCKNLIKIIKNVLAVFASKIK